MLEENLKRIRKEAGMTQDALAKEVGVTQVMIAQYEKGYKTPSVPTLARIAKVFGRSIDDFLS